MATKIVTEIDESGKVDLADLAETLTDIRDALVRIVDIMEAGR